jgi:glycosyltransferase involved in cell wall biosynthesis
MNQKLISVIIPCYNYGRFLPEAVESVRQQSYAYWECHIVDDGSQDDTREVATLLAASDRRIIYHYKTNGGLSSARNYGIAAAKGEYLCFLDADDLFDRDKLQRQADCFSHNPQADIVYGKAMFFESSNAGQHYHNKQKTTASELLDFSGSGNRLIGLLNRNNITVVSTPLIKKVVFARVGNFDESYRSYEDWHFWIRCALAGCSFVYCSQPPVCTYIRFGHESMMSNKRKLLLAGIQLRKFLAARLPWRFRPYNAYRLLRSRLKLAFIK